MEKSVTEHKASGRRCALGRCAQRVQLRPVQWRLTRDVLASFSRDQAPMAAAGSASALVRARSAADVERHLRFAHEQRIPVVARGAGTGLAGVVQTPVDRCILLSLVNLNRILSVDRATRTAVVEAGVLNGVLASAAAEHGLFYAPDPASREISTIGGNIATNAGGACCLKYGVTGDHVAALKLVLPDGTTLRTGGISRKNVAGFDLTRLLVGSEGHAGRHRGSGRSGCCALPARPPTLLAFFDTLTSAAAAIAAMDESVDLSLLEIMGPRDADGGRTARAHGSRHDGSRAGHRPE